MKYRVWDYTDKKMLYFEGIFNKAPFECESMSGLSNGMLIEGYKPHELSDEMLCTEYRDMSGNLIYESDIVFCKAAPELGNFEIRFGEHPNARDNIPWRIKGFYENFGKLSRTLDLLPMMDGNFPTLMIIGSTYENQELLEGK